MGDLVGASNIFNFVYNTLQLNTLDPTSDVGLAQMVMGSQTHGVTPTALAAAFQIFYDGGYTTPHLYTRVLDRDGNIYLENNATSYQALTPQTAYVMNRLLKNVLYSNVGTASGRYPNSNGMESFGKTGTASDEKDLWFVGGTPYYVTAVWWGYDAPYDMTNTLSKDQAKTRTCVMAWKAYMEQVQANLPYRHSRPPTAWWSVLTAPRAVCWPAPTAPAAQRAITAPTTCPIPATTPTLRASSHRRWSRTPPTSTPTDRKTHTFSVCGCHSGKVTRHFTHQNWTICQKYIRPLAMQGAGCYYIFCKNTCVCEVNKLERRFYLVDAQVLPEVFLKVVKAKELLASGEARSISAATRSVDLSRSAFYKYKDCIFDSENGREVITVMATLRDETGALQSLLAGISAAGASIVTINQSTPENGAALVAVTIRTDTMQMTPEELTEKLSRQRMVVGVHCGYNL